LEEQDSDSTAAPSTQGTPSKEDAREKRMAPVWIPATLCLGLLIAAVYLGARILSAHSHATSAPVKAMAMAPVQPPLTVETKAAAADVAPAIPSAAVQAASRASLEPAPQRKDDQVPMIAPQAGQRYLQIGALNLEAARRYVKRLGQANLEPHVAPGPTPELLRVLIGPFADQDSLIRAQNELERAGIENFARKY
jgi:cell division septation protein DedD